MRRELYDANEASKKEGLKLEIEGIDVEFAVEIVKGADASGKLSFNVWHVVEGELKGGGNISNARSHSIKLHLRPKIDNKPVHISDSGTPEDD